MDLTRKSFDLWLGNVAETDSAIVLARQPEDLRASYPK
jgi:hypothetical protein